MTRERDKPAPTGVPAPGTSPRQTGYSSGDRNTKRTSPGRDANAHPGDERDWPVFHGGEQRDATPAAPDPSADPVERRPKR